MSSNRFKQGEFGKYPDDWSIGKLGNHISILTDYHANGSYKKLKENVELLDKENYAYMIRTTNFEKNAFEKNDFKYITKNAYNFLEKTKVYPKDILMNKIANAGSVYLVPKLDKPISLAMNLFLIRMDNVEIDQEYCYYFMKNYEKYIKTRAEGSVTKTITKDNVKKLEIAFPSIQEQRKMVNILGQIEKKIEINNQINKNLEDMAQAIFKHWFVDFEFPNDEGKPYKSSGGKMVESEMGLIPEGWSNEELGSLIKFIKGKKPNFISEKIFENSEKYLTIDALSGNKVEYAINEKIILTVKEDILMVMDGASSGTLYYGMNGIVGSTLSKILITDLRINSDILYYFLKINEHTIKSHLTGSAIPHTDKQFVNKLVMPIPKDKILLSKATKVLSDIRKQIIINNEQSNILVQLRDAILPKLMSGEVRVSLGEE